MKSWTFGSDASLETAVGAVVEVVGGTVTLHDSEYRGGDYFRIESSHFTELIVQANFADKEGELAEPDHSRFRTLIYASSNSEDCLFALSESRVLKVVDQR